MLYCYNSQFLKAGDFLLCNIIVIKTNELLLPNQTYSFQQSERCTGIYLELPGGLECKIRKRHKSFSKPYIMISRHLRLYNPTEVPLAFRGFAFKLADSLQSLIPLHQEAVSIQIQDLKEKEFMDNLAAFFADPWCLNRIALLEQSFPLFLKRLKVSNKHAPSAIKPAGKIDARLILRSPIYSQTLC